MQETGKQKISEGVEVQSSQGMTGLDVKDMQGLENLENCGKKQGIELKLLQVSVPVSLAWCPKMGRRSTVLRILVSLSMVLVVLLSEAVVTCSGPSKNMLPDNFSRYYIGRVQLKWTKGC